MPTKRKEQQQTQYKTKGRKDERTPERRKNTYIQNKRLKTQITRTTETRRAYIQ